jgi:ribonuclease G
MYQGSKPLMETYGVDEEIKNALLRRVDLPSGGYLVIEATEALTVIDVNTGRYVGRTRLEDTILKTNIEACREVVRQLRLRDIGGIIIIDFIDMARPRNRQQVLETLGKELESDRTKTYIVELSPLGLVEMTRQNVTEGLRDILTKTCPTCEGEGVIVSEETMAFDIERRLRRLAETSSSKAFLVEVHPKVAAMLIGQGGAKLKEIEQDTGKYFSFEGLETIPIDTFEVSAEGSREEIQRASLPVAEGDEVRLRIEEPHMYNPSDGIARIDGYVVSIAGAGKQVGSDAKVHINSVTRTCAYGSVVDETARDEARDEKGDMEDIDLPKRQDWGMSQESDEGEADAAEQGSKGSKG